MNAKAIAEYIQQKQPEKVSLVAMGNGGIDEAKEDVLCAQYIKSLLLGETFDLAPVKHQLLKNGGERFHRLDTQDSQPKEDFQLCLDFNIFLTLLSKQKSLMIICSR